MAIGSGNMNSGATKRAVEINFAVAGNGSPSSTSYKNIATALRKIFDKKSLQKLTEIDINVSERSIKNLKTQIEELSKTPVTIEAVIKPVGVDIKNIDASKIVVPVSGVNTGVIPSNTANASPTKKATTEAEKYINSLKSIKRLKPEALKKINELTEKRDKEKINAASAKQEIRNISKSENKTAQSGENLAKAREEAGRATKAYEKYEAEIWKIKNATESWQEINPLDEINTQINTTDKKIKALSAKLKKYASAQNIVEGVTNPDDLDETQRARYDKAKATIASTNVEQIKHQIDVLTEAKSILESRAETLTASTDKETKSDAKSVEAKKKNTDATRKSAEAKKEDVTSNEALAASEEKSTKSTEDSTKSKEKQAAALEAISNKIKTFQQDYSGILGGSSEQSQNLASGFNSLLTSIANGSISANEAKQKFNELADATRRLDKENRAQITTQTQLSGLMVKGRIYYDQYAKSISKNPELAAKWNTYFDALGKGKYKTQEARQALNELMIESKNAGVETEKITDKIRASFSHRIGFTLSAMVFSTAISSLRKVYTNVVQLNSAMTQLRIITQDTETAYKKFADQAAATATKIGRSMSDIVSSAETWARLGYSLSESGVLAEATGIFANVAAVSEEEATTTLTSVLKAYDYSPDDVLHIVDILTEVGQKYAISAEELGVALQRGGAALATAGNTLEESVALMAAGNASVQNAESVGTALKTTTLRIAGSKTELEEMGEDVDDLASSTSKMRKEILALSGVDIMLDKNTYKSTYQILTEIASVWDDLSNVSQMSLLEGLAGKRNASVIASIINNIKDLNGAYSDAINSEGVASKAQETALDSIEGKQKRAAAQFEDFSRTVLDSELVKAFYDIGYGVTWFITQIFKLKSAIPIIAAITLAIKGTRTALVNMKTASRAVTIIEQGFSNAFTGDAYNNAVNQSAQYLSALTPKVREMTMAQLNLYDATKAAIASKLAENQADAVSAPVKMMMAKATAEQGFALAGLTQEQIDEAMLLSGVSDKTRILTKAKLEQIQATLIQKSTEAGLSDEMKLQYLNAAKSLSTVGNTGMDAFGKLKTGAKGFWTTLNTPTGWITLILTAVSVLSSVASKYIKTQDDYIESAKEQLDLLDETNNKLEENNKKYDELIERKRVLLSLGDNASAAEASELITLNETIAKLESENAILREQLRNAEINAKNDLISAYGHTTGNTTSLGTVSLQNTDEYYNYIRTLDAEYKTRYDNGYFVEAGDLDRKRYGSAASIYAMAQNYTYRSEVDPDARAELLKSENEELSKREELIQQANYEYNKNATSSSDQQINEIIIETKLRRDMWMIASGAAEGYSSLISHLNEFDILPVSQIQDFVDKMEDPNWINSDDGKSSLYQLTQTFKMFGVEGLEANQILSLFKGYLNEASVAANGLSDSVDHILDGLSGESEIYNALKDPISALAAAQKDMSDSGYVTYENMLKLKELGLDEYLIQVADGYKLTSGALDDYLSNTRESIKAEIESAKAKLALAKANAAVYSGMLRAEAIMGNTEVGKIFSSKYISDAETELADLEKKLANYDRVSAMLNRESASSSSSDSDPHLEQWKNVKAKYEHLVAIGKLTQQEYINWLVATTASDGYLGQYASKYVDELNDAEEEIYNYRIEKLEEGKDAIEALFDFREEQLKRDVENQKDALEEELDAIEEFYDKQIEMLEDQYDEEDYLEEQSEKRKELSRLKSQMDMLSRDDSAWAKKRLAELEDEYNEADKEYQKWEREHARDTAKELLEDQKEAGVKSIQDQIDALEKTLDDDKKLREQAIQDILSGNITVYKSMLSLSEELGTTVSDNITGNWLKAAAAIDAYKTSAKSLVGVDWADNEAVRFFTEYISSSTRLSTSGVHYASGTSNASGGIAITQESGPEAIMRRIGGLFTLMSPGDKVFNAEATDFLYNLANNPSDVLAKSMSAMLSRSSISPAFATGAYGNNIDMGDVIINGSADSKTVSEFKRAKRELVNELLQEFKKLR